MKSVTYELNMFPELYEMTTNTDNYNLPVSGFKKCRFCNVQDPEKFKSKAHIIPEFTGNKDLIYYSECDDCNNKFSLYERDLSIFGGILNVFARIKGKKKYPKHKDTKNSITAFSTKDTIQIQKHQVTDAVKIENGIVSVESETQKFRPRYVLKALVKIALSLMDETELYKFTKTFEWLASPEDEFTPDEHPMFLLIERETDIPLKKPAAILMKKKTEYNCPEYSFLFFYGFFAYQIFLPFNDSDKDLNFDNLKLPLSNLVVAGVSGSTNVEFNHYFMTTLKKVRLKDEFKRKLK